MRGEPNHIRKRTTRAVLTTLLADRIEWSYAKVLLFPGYDRGRGDDGKATHHPVPPVAETAPESSCSRHGGWRPPGGPSSR
jgi:hypothetical protein